MLGGSLSFSTAVPSSPFSGCREFTQYRQHGYNVIFDPLFMVLLQELTAPLHDKLASIHYGWVEKDNWC